MKDEASQRRKRDAGLYLYLVAAYAITVPSMFVAEHVVASAELFAALKILCIAAFAWHATAVLLGKRRGEASSARALAAATGLTWSAVIAVFLYKVVAMAPFNWLEAVSSLDDAGRTLVRIAGEHGVLLTLAALIALLLVAIVAAWVVLQGSRALASRAALGARSALLCVGLLCYVTAADLWYAAGELMLYRRPVHEQLFGIPQPFMPDYSTVPVAATESVFILQLESVNTFAVFERTADPSGFRPRIAQPGLDTILEAGGGILFPLFWANGTQTNRAWESILCAISGNVGAPFASEPLRLLRRTCLPAQLTRAGYATVFLYSYFDTEFFNMGNFARRAGFQDIAYGPKLMAALDRRHEWAYDDCVFYDRAFDYLAKHGLDRRERVFAYFEVGMNHAPFFNTMKYPEAHPYPQPKRLMEHYLNSVAEQDHCLRTFWKRFQELGRDDVHLFILPDHSLWVPGVAAEPDMAFATWLAYVPPARRAAAFKPRKVVSPTPSQAQLYPTVLELLGGPPLSGSFAFTLRGEHVSPHYDDCHLLSEPGQRLIMRKNGERVELRLRTGEIVSTQGTWQAADYWRFRDRFTCSANFAQ